MPEIFDSKKKKCQMFEKGPLGVASTRELYGKDVLDKSGTVSHQSNLYLTSIPLTILMKLLTMLSIALPRYRTSV